MIPAALRFPPVVVPSEPVALSSRLAHGAQVAVGKVAQAARYVELDDFTTAIVADVNHPAVTVANTVDGLVTVFDGFQMVKQAREDGDRLLATGGVARMVLGGWGLIPGLAGCYGEVLLGTWCVGEACATHDVGTMVNGATQIGLAGSVAAYTLRLMPYSVMLPTILGLTAIKLSYNLAAQQKEPSSTLPS